VTVNAAASQSSISMPALPRSNDVHCHAASRPDQTGEREKGSLLFQERNYSLPPVLLFDLRELNVVRL
jgi:hypothetical protein